MTSLDWALAGTGFRDKELPSPFDVLAPESNNFGAVIWVHLASGAMIAAVPTAEWKESGSFQFHYAAPNADKSLPMQMWCDESMFWDGSAPQHAFAAQNAVVEFMNLRLGLEPIDQSR